MKDTGTWGKNMVITKCSEFTEGGAVVRLNLDLKQAMRTVSETN